MSHKLRFNSLEFFHIWTSLCPCVVFALQFTHKTLRLSHSAQSPPCTTTNSKPRRPQVNNIISRPIPHMGQGNYKLCMSSHHATSITHTRAHTSIHTLGDTPLRSPTTLHTPTISSLSFPVYPSLSACHSLSLALCKIALRRAATVLRNSVIYWQFPP